MATQANILSTLEAEAEGPGIQGLPGSHDSPALLPRQVLRLFSLLFKAQLFNFTEKETDPKQKEDC